MFVRRASLLFLASGLAACGDWTTKAGLDPFLFPERLSETVPFPLPATRTGVVTGRVLDSSGAANRVPVPVPGVKVSNGSVYTFTGNGIDPVGYDTGIQASGASRIDKVSGSIQRLPLIPARGQFILAGLPVDATGRAVTTLTFTFDEVMVTREVEVKQSTYSADVAATNTEVVTVGGDQRTVNKPFGVQEISPAVALPFLMPKNPNTEAARIALIAPEALTCVVQEASGSAQSQPTFPDTGSRVSFGIRNLPGGQSCTISSVKVRLKSPDGRLVGDDVRLAIDPVLLEAGQVNRSGSLAKVTVDLALQGLVAEKSLTQMTAEVRFLRDDGGEMRGPDDNSVVRNIPIRITR